jgi:hypothetical protein
MSRVKALWYGVVHHTDQYASSAYERGLINEMVGNRRNRSRGQ